MFFLLQFLFFRYASKATLRQKTEPATEKSPTGKIAIPMKKFCTTEIIPSAPQNISTPPPHPNNLNLPGKFYCHLPKFLTTQASQTKYQPLSEKNCQPFLKTFNPYRLQKQCEPLPKNRNS